MEKSAFIYIETYGCSANSAESQAIAGLLSRAGHEIVKNPDNADMIIVNTCSVKATTVNKILFRIKELAARYPEKKLFATGCLPETELEELSIIGSLNIVSTGRILDIAKFASESLSGKRVYETGNSRDIKICLPKIRDNPVIDIIPICSGCASACAFCATRIAKGRIFSYPAEKIISEIKSARSFGTKEFWITGQDVSAYGMDEQEFSSLPKLIEAITENITGKYFLRLGMMNPKNIKPTSNELLRSFRSDKVFKFLHIPVQSGSDRMLKKMNRQHTAEDFIEIVEKFRRHYPRITIRTDIITGFPEESEEDFELSVELIKKIKPDFTNISMFSSHHKTPAARMRQISSEKKKERSSRLSEIAKNISLEKNKSWIGWQGEVLVDEFKKDKQNYISRNFAYKPIVLRSAAKLALGSFVNVRITETRQTCLIGEII